MSFSLNENIKDLDEIDKIDEPVNIGEYAYFDYRLKKKKLYYIVKTDLSKENIKCHHTFKDYYPSNINIINLGVVKEIVSKNYD